MTKAIPASLNFCCKTYEKGKGFCKRKIRAKRHGFSWWRGVDSFNSAGLHLCNTPKRQHRKVVRHAMRVAVFQKKQPNPPLSHTKKHILRYALLLIRWIRPTA